MTLRTHLLKASLMASTILLTLSTPNLAFAQTGGTAGGGGSSMEPEFKSIAKNIQEWIKSGNAKELPLPSDISFEEYKEKMLKELSQYNIEMTTKAVKFGGKEKTCRSAKNTAGKNFIQCNLARFENDYKNNINEAYRLVHHEFAGLGLLEKNIGADSDYRISNHISKFLKEETVMRLPVRQKEIRVLNRVIEVCNENTIRESVLLVKADQSLPNNVLNWPQDEIKITPKNFLKWASKNSKNPLNQKLNQVKKNYLDKGYVEEVTDEAYRVRLLDLELTFETLSISNDKDYGAGYWSETFVSPVKVSGSIEFMIEVDEMILNTEALNEGNYALPEFEQNLVKEMEYSKWQHDISITKLGTFKIQKTLHNDGSCRQATQKEISILLE